MRLTISVLYSVVLININMIFAQQQSVMLNGAKVVECAQKLNLGTDMEKLKQVFSDPNHPNEICARLCIYQGMELVDDNFEIVKQKFAMLLKQSGHTVDEPIFQDCLASTEALKNKICEYATSRVHCFITKPQIKF
ncbi:unnamed protein product [Chironomus riparius]|uniref:Odorant-binding protein n=1 Tax=Chironomus riparius TaxID=315576 RepID=A0A9N9WPN9_9DIPT|nr:unnamed protein product [Chironomus riparius]